MFANYFRLLSLRLRQQVPALKQVALFNGQYLDTDRALPLFPPAVLIEFGEMQWLTRGLHTQEAPDAQIMVHVVNDCLMPVEDFDLENFNTLEYDAQVLQLVEDVHQSLHGYALIDDTGVTHSTELVRISSRPDTSPQGVHVWVLTYRCALIDNTANRDRALVPHTIQNLDVRKQAL